MRSVISNSLPSNDTILAEKFWISSGLGFGTSLLSVSVCGYESIAAILIAVLDMTSISITLCIGRCFGIGNVTAANVSLTTLHDLWVWADDNDLCLHWNRVLWQRIIVATCGDHEEKDRGIENVEKLSH